MLQDRGVLEDNILHVLDDITTFADYNAEEIINNVQEKLYARNILEGGRILRGSVPLSIQSHQALGLVAKFLYEETRLERVNPEKFFTPDELSVINNFKREVEDIITNVQFKNFIKVREGHWIGVMSIQEIKKLYDNNKINYNPATQREAAYKEFDDKIVMIPKTYPSKVKEITDLLLKKLYKPDVITFNILRNGFEKFEYKNNNITVHEGRIDVSDGWHRSQGIINALIANPNLEYNFPIEITNFDIDEAMQHIKQRNKQTKISEQHLKSMEVELYENRIVKKLNENSKSELRGKIATDDEAVLKRLAYVKFSILSTSIKNYFDIKNAYESDKIADYLIDFFNIIYGMKYDDFVNLNKQSYITRPLGFTVLTFIASRLYKQEGWRVKLENIVENINWNNNNEELNDIDFKQLTKPTLKRIEEKFKKVV